VRGRMPKEKDGVLDEASIKAASKQFDLSLVFKLNMPRMGIRRICNLDLVPSLTELDLSSNKLARIEGVAGLESLKRLVLANNDIERIEGLESLESLETLLLQGNRVSNLDDVNCIVNLPSLRHFQLASKGGEEKNPMCDHPAYRTAIRRMLPRLQTLDGENVKLTEASLPKELSGALDDLIFADPEPWLKDFDWGELANEPAPAASAPAGRKSRSGGSNNKELPQKASSGPPLKGEAEFDAVVVECKRLDAKAKTLIEDMRCRTPR